jgi:hypothetical protein
VSRLEYSSEYVINVIATKASRINTHTHTQTPSQDTDPTKLFLSFEGIYDAEKAKGVVFLAAQEVAMRSSVIRSDQCRQVYKRSIDSCRYGAVDRG